MITSNNKRFPSSEGQWRRSRRVANFVAKILEIGEGTSEVQRMLIARELGLSGL